MVLFDQIQAFIDRLEEKQFYQYLAVGLGITCFATGIIVFRSYRNISSVQKKIEEVNTYREQIKEILNKAQQVRQKEKEVNAILAEEEDFKIAGYFKDLLEQLGLTNKLSTRPEVISSTEDAYTEDILTAKFTDMTMKKLTELLQEIEKKQRIYTKELDITASQKTKNAIEVTIAIGTLLPKTKETE